MNAELHGAYGHTFDDDDDDDVGDDDDDDNDEVVDCWGGRW